MEHVSSTDCQAVESVNQTVDCPWLFQPLANRDQLLNEVCERLERGESLISICSSAHLPSRSALLDWSRADDQIADRIRRARELGEDAIAHDTLRIADGLMPANPGGVSDPQRDKLRVETRLKLLAKFNPKRWGDSTQLRHADADGGKLDTAPLVSELLALMPGATPAAQPATRSPAPTHRVISESRIESPATQSARPAYRPRAARSDVDDLV